MPFDQTFKTAIAACRGIKGANGLNGPEYWERMERVVDAISRRGASPSNDVLLRMGMACVHAKEWEKAAALFENAVSSFLCLFLTRGRIGISAGPLACSEAGAGCLTVRTFALTACVGF